MKGIYSFSIPQNRIKSFSIFIESKKDVYNIILATLDFLFSGAKEKPHGNFKILFKSERRLFFFEDNRYYSFSFPFSLSPKLDVVDELSNAEIPFCEKYSLFAGDDELTSSILVSVNHIMEYVMHMDDFSLDELYENIDELRLEDDDFYNEEEFQKAWRIACRILLMETSYVRYDHDVGNEKTNHPLNHLDVNYSDYGTYKIGLPKAQKPKMDWFVELCSSNPVKVISKL